MNLIDNDTDIIHKVLKENLHGERDNDVHLIISVLQEKGINPDQVTLAEYLRKMQSGEFPYIESITRIRRMAQKLNPSLYGKKVSVRKGYRVKKCKQELNTIFDNLTGQGLLL